MMHRSSPGFLRSLTQTGQFYLWVATLVFAASNALTRKLNMIGHSHLIDGRNPISLCNVLFVGNLCALVVMLCLFSKDLRGPEIRTLRRRDWASLVLIGLLSGALVPALIFSALDRTSVANVVIIGRLEPPLSLMLSFLFLGIRFNRYTFLGAVLACIGVSVTAVLSPQTTTMMMSGFRIGQGEVMVGIAAIILAIANVLSKVYLKTVSLGLFSIVRTVIGTIVFFVIAQVLYGPHHFMDVLSPFLWGWMVIYSLFIVVIGQLCSFKAQKTSTVAELTLASSFQPLIAIFMGFLILGEVPIMAQWIGGSILMLSIGLSAIGTIREAYHRQEKLDQEKLDQKKTEMTLVDGLKMGSDFRGV